MASQPPRPPQRVAHLQALDLELIRNMYKVLGGDPGSLDRLHPGNYEFAFYTPEGLPIELDEEQRFDATAPLTLAEHVKPR